MAVKLRLKRAGRRNRAFYRIVAADARAQRDGRTIERLGYYDPLVADKEKKVSLTKDRIEYWLSVGAQPTVTVANLLRERGIKFPKPEKSVAAKRMEKRKKRAAPKKGKPKVAVRNLKKAGAAAKKKKKKTTKKASAKKKS
ncbi:MAG: 30S ribosomal protein S16 [Planctomycetota bacterium]|nr:30S ribosomal protein S16 [Planctomycetota bacterium]